MANNLMHCAVTLKIIHNKSNTGNIKTNDLEISFNIPGSFSIPESIMRENENLIFF